MPQDFTSTRGVLPIRAGEIISLKHSDAACCNPSERVFRLVRVELEAFGELVLYQGPVVLGCEPIAL